MSEVAENLKEVLEELPENVRLVAVSKTKPIEMVKEAYGTGHRIFGENRVQELRDKQPELPDDIQWHMIGHLQSNKVKYIAPYISMIHAVDSLKLLKEINKQGKKNSRIIPCLLQFHIADESSKYGLSKPEAKDILESDVYRDMQYVQISGVMGMATLTDDTDQIHKEFKALRDIFYDLKTLYFSDDGAFKEISMGMSGDYEIAIEEGSTMVRLGSSIFGERG